VSKQNGSLSDQKALNFDLDGTSDVENIAADLLAQAEHDTDSSAILVTTSDQEAEKVEEEIEKQLENLETSETARKALEENGFILVKEDLEQAMRAANDIAPEHLEIQAEDAKSLLDQVRNAGTVFIGEKSVEALGDYTSGTNHVLPTGGSARFRGGLSVKDFVKTISWEAHSEKSLENIGRTASKMAEIESLPAHRKSVEKRLQKD
jgi:histidinol dehydrogenase